MSSVKLIERIKNYDKYKNLNLKDKIKLLTPQLNTKLTGYMLFLKSTKLDVKSASEKWKALSKEQKDEINKKALEYPPINNREDIPRSYYNQIRQIQLDLAEEWKLSHPNKNIPSRLQPIYYPRSKRDPPTPWQLYLSTIKADKYKGTTQEIFRQRMKDAASQWKNLSDDKKSMFISQSQLQKSIKQLKI